jgi:hypothetical protein
MSPTTLASLRISSLSVQAIEGPAALTDTAIAPELVRDSLSSGGGT